MHELQQKYTEVKGTTQTISLTQRLLQMHKAKVLKEQVDVSWHKEEVLKEHLYPWIDEAYAITASIKGKFVKMQAAQQTIQSISHQIVSGRSPVGAAQCTTDIAVIQVEMGALRTKISALVE